MGKPGGVFMIRKKTAGQPTYATEDILLVERVKLTSTTITKNGNWHNMACRKGKTEYFEKIHRHRDRKIHNGIRTSG